MGSSKSSSKRKVYGHKSPPQETGTIPSKQPNLTPKGTRKRLKKQKQNSKLVEEIIKIRAEIN